MSKPANPGRPCRPGLQPPSRRKTMRVHRLLGVLMLCLMPGALPTLGADAEDPPAKPPDLRVLPPEGDAHNPPARSMLHRFLLDQARRHFDARRLAIAAIKTPEAIARR